MVGWAAVLMALGGAIGCRGCQRDARQPPERFIAKNAEGVVQVPNIGILVERREEIRALFGGVINEAEVRALEGELVRVLGFDPTTEEGLKSAGLPKSGPLAIEVARGGRAALWIVPVEDGAKLAQTVERIAKARMSVDSVKARKIAGRDATVLATSWGQEEVPIAAILVDSGHAFIGAGRAGLELIEQALARPESAALRANPEYAALDQALGWKTAARFIAPTATVTAARFANRQDLGRGLAAEIAGSLQSIGWAFDLEARAIAVRGRLRLAEQARLRLGKIFAGGREAPDGVRSVGGAGGVVSLMAGADPRALIAELAPEGSPLRPRVDEVFGAIRRDFGLDFEKEVLPHLSGHAAIAVGVGDVSKLTDLAAALENPAALLWSVGAFGVRDEGALGTLQGVWQKIEPDLQRQGLLRGERTRGSSKIAVISVPGSDGAAPAEPRPEQVIVESFAGKGAWVLSNDPRKTDVLMGGGSPVPADPLAGRGGLQVEVRFSPLSTALRSVDLGTLAGGAGGMMVRAMAAKALAILERLDRAEVRVEHVPEGLSVAGRLTLNPPAAKN